MTKISYITESGIPLALSNCFQRNTMKFEFLVEDELGNVSNSTFAKMASELAYGCNLTFERETQKYVCFKTTDYCGNVDYIKIYK